MKKILHLISSPNGNASLSIQLGHAIIQKIQAQYPGSTVVERHLVDQPLGHLTAAQIGAFYTPEDSRDAVQNAQIQDSERALSELFDADILVVGAPMYNFSIHSSLKAWIDQVARAGKTFAYDANGPRGLVTGKKVYIATASGGVYSSGPYSAFDFGVPYLKAVLGFLGMTDVSVFRIEGIKLPDNEQAAIQAGLDSILID